MILLRLVVEGCPFISLDKKEWYRPSETEKLNDTITRIKHKKPWFSIKVETEAFPEFEKASQVREYHRRNHWRTENVMRCSNPVCRKLQRQEKKKAEKENVVLS